MSQTKNLKTRLRAGKPAIGCWVELCSPLAAEIVGGAGYDCVMIDMEHGPGSYLEAIAAMQAMSATPTVPLLRVPSNDRVAIKRALDSGASGVMVPAVNSAEEARAAVESCLYPPRGKRGMAASIVRATDYGRHWQEYVAEFDDQVLVICQIESREGVENVEAIAAVEGVDLLFIGPFDLSANLGHLGQPDHPQVREAIARVEAAAKAAGKWLGAIQTPERPVESLIGDGYNLILPDADNALLRDALDAAVARWRKAAPL